MSEESKESKTSHGVRGIFDILKSQIPPPQFSEKELTSLSTERNSNTSYVPDAFREIYEKLPEERKNFYKYYGQEYYSRVIDAAQNSVEKASKELLLAAKSGLCPKEFSSDELAVLRSIYGKAWYLEAGITESEFTQLMNEKDEEERVEREKVKEKERAEQEKPEENEAKEMSGTLLM